jgi:hypothetical protein
MENLVLPRADGGANPYSYDLMLECDGDGSELVLSWVFSRAIHRQETIRAVAEDYFAQLAALVGSV